MWEKYETGQQQTERRDVCKAYITHIEEISGQKRPTAGGDTGQWYAAQGVHERDCPDCRLCEAKRVESRLFSYRFTIFGGHSSRIPRRAQREWMDC